MWHQIVSSMDSMAHVVMPGFIQMSSQHPLTTIGILLLFLVLAAMLCAEIVGNFPVSRGAAPALTVRSIGRDTMAPRFETPPPDEHLEFVDLRRRDDDSVGGGDVSRVVCLARARLRLCGRPAERS